MVTAAAARWLLTAVFTGTALGSVAALWQAGVRRAADRVSDALHALMCAALVVMTWWSEPTIAVWLQTALFGCAMLWFGVTGTRQPGSSRLGRWPGFHHALMAGAMIWMITAMPMHLSGPAHNSMRATSHPTAVLVLSVLLAGNFSLAAVCWLARAVNTRGRLNDRAAASHGVISAGMATMLLAML